MQPVDRNYWLTLLAEQVEGHIQVAVLHLQNLDEATLRQPSPDGGWSIAQCLDHLNSYGRYYLPYLQQGLARPPEVTPGDRTYVSSWLGAYLIRLIDPERSRVKFKASKRHLPAQNLDPHLVVTVFIKQQEWLLTLLKLAYESDVNKVKIPLSIAAWVRLPIGDILSFLVVHTKRHLLQVSQQRYVLGAV